MKTACLALLPLWLVMSAPAFAFGETPPIVVPNEQDLHTIKPRPYKGPARELPPQDWTPTPEELAELSAPVTADEPGIEVAPPPGQAKPEPAKPAEAKPEAPKAVAPPEPPKPPAAEPPTLPAPKLETPKIQAPPNVTIIGPGF